MLRQHSIPHIVQTAAGKFRLSGTSMFAVPSASFTPTSNLSLYMSARSFRIFGTAVHFYFDFSGRRAALACSCEGGKSGNPMPLRFPSGYPQRFNILSGGHSLNAPRVHRADTVQGSPTRVPRFLRIVIIIRGPEFSQNLIGEQVQNRVSEDSSGGFSGKTVLPASLFYLIPGSARHPQTSRGPRLNRRSTPFLTNRQNFFAVERPQERAGIIPPQRPCRCVSVLSFSSNNIEQDANDSCRRKERGKYIRFRHDKRPPRSFLIDSLTDPENEWRKTHTETIDRPEAHGSSFW